MYTVFICLKIQETAMTAIVCVIFQTNLRHHLCTHFYSCPNPNQQNNTEPSHPSCRRCCRFWHCCLWVKNDMFHNSHTHRRPLFQLCSHANTCPTISCILRRLADDHSTGNSWRMDLSIRPWPDKRSWCRHPQDGYRHRHCSWRMLNLRRCTAGPRQSVEGT